MTVTSSTNSAEYAGNGVSTNFTVPFRFLDDSHLRVVLVDADGTEHDQVLNTNYTASGAGNATGGITFTLAPANGKSVQIFRNVPITQEKDYVTGDKFPAESHEQALDKLTMIAQQQDEKIGRAWLSPVGEPGGKVVAGPDGAVAVFDADGNLQGGEALYVVFDGAWNSGDTYLKNHLVTYGGNIWLAKIQNSGTAPVEGDTWTLFLPGATTADESIDADKLDRDDRQAMLDKLGVEAKGANLVDKMLAGVPIRGMYIRGTNVGFNIGVGMSADLKSVVEYRFWWNTDGLLLLRGAYSGVEDDTKNTVQPNVSGATLVTTSAPASYTTTVDDTLTFTFTGQSFSFRYPSDNRGGVWEFTLSNGDQRRVSTWSNGTTPGSTFLEQRVFENLPYGTYDCIAKFLGDDPVHAPTGGTSRGWLRYKADGTAGYPIHIGKFKPIDASTQQVLIESNSVADFAISARPAAASYASEWVPQHSTVSGVSGSVIFKIIVDGVVLSSTTGDVSLDGIFRECENIEIMHKFNALNPNGSDGAMWNHWVMHSIKKDDPRLRILNRIVVAQDTLATGYIAPMLPVRTANVTRMVLNNGLEVTPVPAPDDNTVVPFGYDVSSAMFAGTYVDGNWHGCAISVGDLRDASSLGKAVQPASPGQVTYRSDYAKAYWNFAANTVLHAGETYSAMGEIAIVSGIRQPNNLLQAI